MKFLDKWTKKLAGSASTAVKTEVKKTVLDLLPAVFGIAAAVVGILVFRESVDDNKPMLTATHITTNNYFFGDAGDEIIKSILEKEDF